jgi:two-component system, NtrC family, response regulator
MKPVLLIIDDDEDIRTQMKWALVKDYDVALAEDRPGALAVFRDKSPQVVLLDLGLPPHPADPQEGMAALGELLAINRQAKVIIISGQGENKNALQAIGEGAYDFLCKPIQMEELTVILKRAFYVAQIEQEYQQLRRQLSTDTFEGMLGTCPQMQGVFSTIRKVATTDAPVLILGESGTGKELAALAIHRRSPRKEGPFVAINCGAIPDALLESELFGHEKGAFTGAHVQRPGRIETAMGGTLFLDEIGELPLTLQVKILRFLQEQIIERVGGRTKIQIDTRVVAATNVDLTNALKLGEFREDLYYRLAVVVMKLPPLRDRAGDVLMLAQVFLARFASENRKALPRFNQEAIRALQQHPWPGNVRELENRVKRAIIMAEGSQVTAADLELTDLAPTALPSRSLKEARDALDLTMVQLALDRNQGKISRAAAELGISRPTLYELMEKLGLTAKSTN